MNRQGGARTTRATRSASRNFDSVAPPTKRTRTTRASSVESNASDASQERGDHKKRVRVEKAKLAELPAVQEDEEMKDEPIVEKSPKKDAGLKKIKPTAAAIVLIKKMGRSKPIATAASPPGSQEQLQQEQGEPTSSAPVAAFGEAAEEQEEMYTDPNVLIAGQLAAMANQNKENEPVKPKRRLIDRQEDAIKVSQITDFEDSEDEFPEPGNLGRRVVQQPKQRQQEEVSDDDNDFAAAPEVISVAGARRRGLPKSRVVPAPEEEQKEEEEDSEAEAARERENHRRIVEARNRNRKEVPVERQVGRVQRDDARPVARSESQASDAPLRYDPYNPPDFSLVNAAAKEGTRKGRAAKAQARRGWSAEETNAFQTFIVTCGTRWAQFENEGALDEFGGRSQSQMKDKAMNMKADYMKAKMRLPANFEDISLRAKQKQDIREQAGIDPDNYEEELNKLGL